MSRPPSKPRTAVQHAIIDLRRHLNLTQLELALALEVTPVTVARWETTYPPRENGLSRLAQFADERGELVYASIFNGALQQAEEIRYRRGSRMADEGLDFEAAIGNVYRAVTAHPDSRLVKHWIRVLDALIPAHRLVIRRAVQDSLPTEKKVQQKEFQQSELPELMKNSINALRELDQRLALHRAEIAVKKEIAAGEELAAQRKITALRDLGRRLAWQRDVITTKQIAAKTETNKPTKKKGNTDR